MMHKVTMNNPHDFERDLDAMTLRELEVFTLLARSRLEERDISIGELKTTFFAGEPVPRPPVMIPVYPPSIIKAELPLPP